MGQASFSAALKMALLAAVALSLVSMALSSRVDEDREQQPRFYDEVAFNEYENDGEEWGTYNAIPDYYSEVERNSNRRKKTDDSGIEAMANNPFDDPFFSEFLRRHKKKQQQSSAQKPAKAQDARPPTPQTTIAPVKKQTAKVTKPPQKFQKEVKQQGKPNETKSKKQNQSELIREFTLMISKLLFQLSQIDE